jgi:hypothetical protein
MMESPTQSAEANDAGCIALSEDDLQDLEVPEVMPAAPVSNRHSNRQTIGLLDEFADELAHLQLRRVRSQALTSLSISFGVAALLIWLFGGPSAAVTKTAAIEMSLVGVLATVAIVLLATFLQGTLRSRMRIDAWLEKLRASVGA